MSDLMGINKIIAQLREGYLDDDLLGETADAIESLRAKVSALETDKAAISQLSNSDGYVKSLESLVQDADCIFNGQNATWSKRHLDHIAKYKHSAPTPDGDRLDGTWQPSSANDGMRFPGESDLIGGLEEVRGPDWIAASSKKSGLID